MIHFSNSSLYKLKSDHKVTNVALCGDEKHLLVSFCCSIIVKVDCRSRKLVSELNLKEMNSFTHFEQLFASQGVLFYTPSKVFLLNSRLEIERQYAADIKKGKFIQNVSVSPDLQIFAIQRSSDIMLFDSQTLELKLVLYGDPSVIRGNKIGFLFVGKEFFWQFSQAFSVKKIGGEVEGLVLHKSLGDGIEDVEKDSFGNSINFFHPFFLKSQSHPEGIQL